MARIMKKFPEILFIDGTYNVNRVGMPLYCLIGLAALERGRRELCTLVVILSVCLS